MERFIPIGPPFAGAFDADANFVGAKNQLYIKILVNYGINNGRYVAASWSGFTDLLTKDVYTE